jgi:hypothetical protein
MRISRVIPACSLLVVTLSQWSPFVLAAAPAKEERHIDFTDVRKERTGEVTVKGYDYAYGDWSKHLISLPERGCLIQAPTGKGGLGENKPMVNFAKYPAMQLVFVVGNANRATSINFSLEDNDGTEQSWSVPLEGLARGTTHHFPLDLTKCTTEARPGKQPGLNLRKISVWQVRGDFTDQKVEVLLVKLVTPK